MVTPHTPASASAAGAPLSSPHLSKKMARHAERLHATFSLRQQAAIDAANREREAWLAWRGEVKARREAKEAAAVQEQLVPGSGKASKDRKDKKSKAGTKDRKSRKLKVEEKRAGRAKKDRKEAKAKARRDKAIKTRRATEMTQDNSEPINTTSAAPSTSTCPPTPRSLPVEEAASAPVASTSATPSTPILTRAPPLPPSPRLSPTPASHSLSPSNVPLLDLTHDSDDGWSDYYSDDDHDPEWLSDEDDGSELAEDDFNDLILEEDEDDSWFFSVPTLSKMASSIRTHLRQERKQFEVDGPGWGVRVIGGGGMVFV